VINLIYHGIYKRFDFSERVTWLTKLREAHNDCQQRCANLMMNSVVRVVVSNTFTQEWEMEPYFEMAKRYGYRVHTIVVENRHGGENIHGVPEDKLEIMKNRFEIKL